MYNPLAYSYGVTSVDPDRNVDIDPSEHTDATEHGDVEHGDGEHGEGGRSEHERTIDVSDSSSSDEDRDEEPEAHIMTVGDCQIVKLPPAEEERADVPDGHSLTAVPVSTTPSAPSSVTITPITTVGDCTIRPVENT